MNRTVIPKGERKTILIMADELRYHSGVGTQTKQIVINTAHHYNWIVIATLINHPEHGATVDYSEEIQKLSGVEDASCIVYPYNTYGDAKILRTLLDKYDISAIVHFTDPRFWYWLYDMEAEIKRTTPIIYYSIWDAPPIPQYNETYYASCDALFGISKQSHAIHTNVLRKFREKFPFYNRDVVIKYIPHGINTNEYFPIQQGTSEWKPFTEFIKGKFNPVPDFVVFWNNRNARRKQPADLMVGYNKFVRAVRDINPKFNPLLIMHTDLVASEHGTDFYKVKNHLMPDCPIMFHTEKLESKALNYLYNMADVTINVASAEGFGLSSAESLVAGTMVINNVTGGLQDQIGLMDDEGNYLTEEHYLQSPDWISNSDGRYQTHGEFAVPVWPACHNIIGHPMTPYIYEEYTDTDSIADALIEVYLLGRNERKRRGLLGRDFALNVARFDAVKLGEAFVEGIDETLAKFVPCTTQNIIKI